MDHTTAAWTPPPGMTPPPGFGYPHVFGGATTSSSVPLPASAADECQFWHIFMAGALAGGAGIRATAPLFLMSAAHVLYPEGYHLSHDARWLGHHYVCTGLGILLIIEILADQVPAIDHALHAILTPAHPLTGALAAVAPNYCGDWTVRAPMAALGAATAFSVHATKAVVRGASSHVSLGVLNPIISLVETIVSMLIMVVCILLPVVAVIVAGVVVVAACFGAKKIVEEASEPAEAEGDALDDEQKQLRRESKRLKKEQRRQERQQQQDLSGFVDEGGLAAEGGLAE